MMKKRLISLFLTLVMAVSVFPVGAWGVETQEEEETLAAEFPIADISSVIGEQLPTESSFIDKNLSAVPRITMSSEVPEDMPYEAYRNPEAILTEDYGYSAAEAASILNGEAEDVKIAYVENEGQLQSAFDSSEVEIVIVTSDFDVESPLNVSKSVTFLASEEHTIRNQIPLEIIPKEDPDNDYSFDYIVSMISAGTKDFPLSTDSRFAFSNVIIDCNASVTAFTIYADELEEQSGVRDQVLVEGLYTVNGAEVPIHYSTLSASIIGYGKIKLLGCCTKGSGGGFFFSQSKKITLQNCNFISSDYSQVGGYIRSTGEFEVQDCMFYKANLGTFIFPFSLTNSSSVRVINCTLKESSIEADYIRNYGIENTNIMLLDSSDGISMTKYHNVEIYQTTITNAGTAIRFLSGVDRISSINIEDSTLTSNNQGYGFDGIFISEMRNPGNKTLSKLTVKDTEISGFHTGIRGFNTTTYLGTGGTRKENWDYISADIINCDIHDNKCGIYGLRELDVLSSKIRNNMQKGIEMICAPTSVVDSEITNNGSITAAKNGGIVYNPFVEEETEVPLILTNTKFIGNKSGKDGGAIYLPTGYAVATISNCHFENNKAADRGGAIFAADYSYCLSTDEETSFSGNTALAAYCMPPNVADSYSNIKFASTSVFTHPINNYDIGYWNRYEGVEIPSITSLMPLEKVLVPLSTTPDELQAILESSRSKVSVVLEDGTTANNIPVIWNVSESEYTGENCAAYTIHGKLNLSGKNYANASSLTANVTVYVGPIVASNPKLEKITVTHGTSVEAVQAQLEQKRSKVSVNLSVNNDDDNLVPVIWKVSESSYNGHARGTYTVYGTLDLTGITTFFNPEGYQAEIEVEVLPPSELEILSVVNPTPITVKQYAMLSNEENKTTEFGSPTIFPRLPEKVTVNLRNGKTAVLPAKWNIWECDTTRVGEQTITVYPICDGTNYWTSDDTVPGKLKVTVAACDYMFIDATVSGISLEVLPGTTVEELNALLKVEGKQELPLYMFDLDSGDQMITFYPLTLKEEHCPKYQKDVPGEYDFIIPWPDNILPPEEGELPELKVTVRVLEPLEIIDVELETIRPYQSVPVGHESFPGVPSQVNVTLEGGMIIPVDVVWDWSTYNEDLAAEQLIIGELVNLPSKAKQPEGQEFTGKLKADVKPVAYEITALLSDDPLVADAGLTLSEITQILQPVLSYRIESVTPGISLTLTREVSVSLEDEKNPQYDPMDAYEDFVVGTLDLPDNITYDPDSGLDLVPLFTFPVEILEYVPCTVIAREGTDFAEIPNMPVTVTAKLSSVGPDGQNKTAAISVNWGTGEGYEPYPADLTDDTCVGVEIEGTLVNKPRYIAATKKKPVLTVSVCREFDIEELSPNRIPGTGELEVPLGSSLEDIYGKLEQHTVQLTLKSTNGVFSQQDVSFELRAEENSGYDPAVEETGSYTLVAHLLHADNIKNPKGLQLEIHIKTMTYDISTAKVTTIKGIAKGTAFEDLPLPETSGAVRDDGETEFLPTTWDNSKYNSTKLGGQFINGTFNTPLPLHLKNPDNRQPKAYITIVDTEATVLSMEQVFEEPAGIRKSRAKAEEIPGYVEHKYLLKLQNKDGTIREEMISLYSEEK